MNELLQVVNDKPMTDSLKIAETFKKDHGKILRTIREKQHLFNESNFGLVDYKDAKGELRPMYLLDRDFTTFLIMGFTGEKADEWKIKYINAFNEMERRLSSATSTDNRLEIAHLIINAPKDRLSFITSLYPEYFDFTDKESLEYIVDRNSSYSTWIQTLGITIDWIGEFPTSDIYNNYLSYCIDNRFVSMGKKVFYKTLENDFNLKKTQKSDGYRYFVTAG